MEIVLRIKLVRHESIRRTLRNQYMYMVVKNLNLTLE